MVRAGVVKHPAEWEHSRPAARSGSRRSVMGVIEVVGLSELYSFPRVADFQQAHRHWVTGALSAESIIRAGPTRGRGTVEEVRQFRF